WRGADTAMRGWSACSSPSDGACCPKRVESAILAGIHKRRQYSCSAAPPSLPSPGSEGGKGGVKCEVGQRAQTRTTPCRRRSVRCAFAHPCDSFGSIGLPLTIYEAERAEIESHHEEQFTSLRVARRFGHWLGAG